MKDRIDYYFMNNKHTITIKMVKRWPRILFMSLFLLIWLSVELLVGLVILASILLKEAEEPFIYFWFVFWSFAGLLVTNVWLWNCFGREIIIIDEESITIRKKYGFIKGKKIKIREDELNIEASGPYGISGYRNFMEEDGTIKIESKDNQINIGYCFTYEEANLFIKMISDMKECIDAIDINSYFKQNESLDKEDLYYNKRTDKLRIRPDKILLNRFFFFLMFLFVIILIISKSFSDFNPIVSIENIEPGVVFLLIWYSVMVFFFLVSIFNVFWSILGYEEIWLNNGRLYIRMKFLVFHYTKKYELTYIESIRINNHPSTDSLSFAPYNPSNVDMIAFDYRNKQKSFAPSISEDKAGEILAFLGKNIYGESS